ncbi:hypothetical protein DH2020_017716 [Rehmannia glutinosa]|uniref:Zinc finger protein n=1 Tax=Rehmannia glutinosa TaxID=99300 RepID=A0ABR0WTB1_REHGL
MTGMWTKLKKALSLKSAGESGSSSSQLPPRAPMKSDSRSAAPSSTTSSSSLSSRFSRSLSSGGRPSKKACAICLGNVRSGQGQAIFTAECSHSFHFSCIASSVKHGNYLCPICRCKWKEIPSNANGARVAPYRAPLEDYTADYSRVLPQPAQPLPEPFRYSDDEPLLVVSTDRTPPSSCAPPNKVSVKAIPEFPAVAAPESVSDFAVLVGLRAPTLLDDARQLDRAPIDLVTVLDVSGSMTGSKLVLVKRAVRFVIENLGSADRLSIVSFSASARRIFPLRRMTDTGREDARQAIDSLSSDGGTDILEGLKKGARVLEERREKNPVASIILLSDGIDTHNFNQIRLPRGRHNQPSSNPTQVLEYLNVLPVSICLNKQNENNPHPTFPVHTFGFGTDHDSSVMHAISDASGGTFSFIESIGMVQDAFARCIGGLLSVMARELHLTVTSTSPGVEICSIPSGRYASKISEDRLQCTINIGDMYADEGKEFLVHLSIPVCPSPDGLAKTPLVKIACSYRDTAKTLVELGERVDIRRPKTLSPTDATMSLEVDRQKNRLSVIETIAEAKEMAESGNLKGAQALLSLRLSTLLSSPSAQAGDALCSQLEAELMETRDRMANMVMYTQTGRAYVLSGLSSHSWQRATTRGGSGSGSSSHSAPVGYDTPTMVTMVTRSQNLTCMYPHREQQVSRHNKSMSLTKM